MSNFTCRQKVLRLKAIKGYDIIKNTYETFFRGRMFHEKYAIGVDHAGVRISL